MSRDPRDQDIADAYLGVQSARLVLNSCMEAFEAKLLNAPQSEITRYREACMSACEALLDRKVELIWAQMRRDGLDPLTRKLL